MKDFLSIIKQPIESELQQFITLFNEQLEHTDGTLQQALNHIKQRGGKRMRPMLVLLTAKLLGTITEETQRAGIGLEMLHTATLVHDDIVDEADTRRGQASVNAIYDNKIAVLVGDYVLSTALINVCGSHNLEIVKYLSTLGQVLSDGEILQLTSNGSEKISEEAYYEVIKKKTAALFEASCAMGAMSVNAPMESVKKARLFGQQIGMIFQIRDDIFDYYDDDVIGKPTGNDMQEGKLTLPAIHAVLTTDNKEMRDIAMKVKKFSATPDEIARLVAFTKQNDGIEYAEQKMQEIHSQAMQYIENEVHDADLKEAFTAYLDYVIVREK